VVAADSLVGIFAIALGAGTAQGALDHVSANKNEFGIGAGVHATVLAVDSTATNNDNRGFFVSSGAVIRLAHSAASGNGIGVFLAAAALAESAGDNFIVGNTTNVSGTLTNVGAK
jgi:hypothetical protein